MKIIFSVFVAVKNRVVFQSHGGYEGNKENIEAILDNMAHMEHEPDVTIEHTMADCRARYEITHETTGRKGDILRFAIVNEEKRSFDEFVTLVENAIQEKGWLLRE